mmetsp:Transcript_160183/g.292521  ORF Transcript_160183/g.292521 Transcript_160183/m.292521 type:complete len:306 (+) Transcript_160183:446-1363(+)
MAFRNSAGIAKQRTKITAMTCRNRMTTKLNFMHDLSNSLKSTGPMDLRSGSANKFTYPSPSTEPMMPTMQAWTASRTKKAKDTKMYKSRNVKYPNDGNWSATTVAYAAAVNIMVNMSESRSESPDTGSRAKGQSDAKITRNITNIVRIQTPKDFLLTLHAMNTVVRHFPSLLVLSTHSARSTAFNVKPPFIQLHWRSAKRSEVPKVLCLILPPDDSTSNRTCSHWLSKGKLLSSRISRNVPEYVTFCTAQTDFSTISRCGFCICKETESGDSGLTQVNISGMTSALGAQFSGSTTYLTTSSRETM